MIFVVGSSRSGTTMTGRILNNHKDIFTFNELHFFEQLTDSERLKSPLEVSEAAQIYAKLTDIQAGGFFNPDTQKYLDKSKKIILDIPRECRTAAEVYKLFVGNTIKEHQKKHGCDQTPRNALYIDDIFRVMSDSKIIFMVRDPRAVLFSQKNRWKRRKYSGYYMPIRETIRTYCNYHPYTIIKLWTAVMKQAKRWENDKRVMVLKYEDWINSSHQALARICNFLEIEYDEKMLHVPYVGSSNVSDREGNTGISNKSKDAWRNGGLTNAEKYICQKVAAQYMKSWDYQDEAISIPYLGLFSQAVIFPLKMTISILLNLNRVKNLKQAILKRL